MDNEPNHQYLRAVTELGNTRRVWAQRDVYSQTGVKLLGKGSPVDSGLYERLVQHKLLSGIDQCLEVEGAVTRMELAGRAEAVLGANGPLAEAMAGIEPGALFDGVFLEPPIAFKLTVARERRPELYLHGIIVSLIAGYLADRAGLAAQERAVLVTAALLHDLGMLHIDPATVTPGHRLSDSERRQLYAHPVVSAMLIEPLPGAPPGVARAIMEHHERIDGSGYPRGIPGERLSRLGRLLAVAEVGASRFDAEGRCRNCGQLELILKLNTHKLDPDFVRLLLPLFERLPWDLAQGAGSGVARVRAGLDGLAAVLSAWKTLYERERDGTHPVELFQVMDFIEVRIRGILANLIKAGFNPRNTDLLVMGAAEDPLSRAEAQTVLEEATWQLGELLNEVTRSWPELVSDAAPGRDASVLAWLQHAARLAGGAPAGRSEG